MNLPNAAQVGPHTTPPPIHPVDFHGMALLWYVYWMFCFLFLGLGQIWASIAQPGMKSSNVVNRIWAAVADCSLLIFFISAAGATLFTIGAVCFHLFVSLFQPPQHATWLEQHAEQGITGLGIMAIILAILVIYASGLWTSITAPLHQSGGHTSVSVTTSDVWISIRLSVLVVVISFVVTALA